MRKLVIVGSGAVGRLTYQIVEDINRRNPQWEVVGFLAREPKDEESLVPGVPLLGGDAWLFDHPDVSAVVAVGSNALRRRIVRRLEEGGTPQFATLIHPETWIGDRTGFGQGCIIYPGALIDPDVVVGDHVIVNKGCTIGHDTELGDFVTLAPTVALGGEVRVGEGCDFGIGATTIQELTIGEWSVIGAGAVVLRDLPDNVTAVGVPAKPMKRREPGWHE